MIPEPALPSSLTVRIDALPTVIDMSDDERDEATRWRDWQSIELATRALRVGDRVTLVHNPLTHVDGVPVPFATATVLAISNQSGRNVWLVAVTDVEAL